MLKAGQVTAGEWNFAVGRGTTLFHKLSQISAKLGDLAEIFVGLQTSADTVFVFKEVPPLKGRTVSLYSKELNETVAVEADC